MGKRLKKKRYIKGLDGIRAIAVVAVILYHLAPFSFQGGFLGVPIFFVVSGYLITDLLFQEFQQNGTIDVKAFYIRRIKRLYPGLVAMVLSTAAYITMFSRGLAENLKSVIGTNFLYVYNWYQINHHESYFDKFGNQSPFTHLWSLSIEGQFYLLWPIFIFVMIKFFKKKQPIIDTILIMILFSALEMAFMYHVGEDPSRVYYGTDTRMFSILIGAGLAVVWPSTSLKKQLPTKPRLILDGIGLGSLLLLALMFTKMTGENELVYRGGMFFFSLAAMILVAVVVHPGADWGDWLDNSIFRWIGKRSYGIYLYQYPVMVFYESKIQNIASHPVLHGLIEIVIILAISELSYRFLEVPLKKFDYSKTSSVVKEFFKADSSYGWKRVYVAIPLLIFVLAAVGAFMPSSVAASDSKDDGQLESVIKNNQKKASSINQKADKKTSKSSSSGNSSVSESSNSSSESNNDGKSPIALTESERKRAQGLQITCVGDSVMADASAKMQEIFPNMYVDAKVGRQVSEIVPILQSLNSSGKLAQTVLISEGTNGPYDENTMEKIMQILGKQRKVYWINVFVPTRRWQDQVNQELKDDAKKYGNLTVIDWYSYCKDHPEWFYDDHVHPNPDGLNYFGPFIAHEILK